MQSPHHDQHHPDPEPVLMSNETTNSEEALHDIPDDEELIVLGEKEVVEQLKKAMMASNTVKHDAPIQNQHTPAADKTQASNPCITNTGAYTSQDSGPFLPQERHRYKIYPTDLSPKEGSLFNPTAVARGGEQVWVNDALSTLATVTDIMRNSDFSTETWRYYFGVAQSAKRVWEVVEDDTLDLEDDRLLKAELFLQTLSDSGGH